MEIPGEDWDDSGPISLWWAELEVSAPALEQAAGCLSAGERARADQYLQAEDRAQFVAARAQLRRILGIQVALAPEELIIEADDGGKPQLVGSALRFNVSRRAGMVLIATSWEMEVGVDVEPIRADVDVEGIARRFFSAAEQRALGTLGPEARRAASFQCWTRKEAYLKGLGTGLRVPPESVEVWSLGGAPATVGAWTVHPVEMAPGFAAAIAGEGRGWVPRAPQTP
jgi:4'-phosphopantetheinyl transferase